MSKLMGGYDGEEGADEVGGSPRSLEERFDEVMIVGSDQETVIMWDEGKGSKSFDDSVFRHPAVTPALGDPIVPTLHHGAALTTPSPASSYLSTEEGPPVFRSPSFSTASDPGLNASPSFYDYDEDEMEDGDEWGIPFGIVGAGIVGGVAAYALWK